MVSSRSGGWNVVKVSVMECKHPAGTPREPIGNLCVVRDESLSHWTVMICPGVTGVRKPMGSFATLGEARQFAEAELVKINSEQTGKKCILHVDDCPCWQKQL